MSLADLITAARQWLRLPGKHDAWHGLHPPQQMPRLLEGERTRAEQTGAPVCALTFAPLGSELASATLEFLAKTLKERLRAGDKAGWLGLEQVCVLLPGTEPTDAWMVADDICSKFPESIPPPVCTVYSYPARRLAHPRRAGTRAVAGEPAFSRILHGHRRLS